LALEVIHGITAQISHERIIIIRVDVACTLHRKKHFNQDHGENSRHSHETCHGAIRPTPEPRKTWIGQRYKCGWQEVDKGGRNQHAGSEMP
jgi:hypothetical protein